MHDPERVFPRRHRSPSSVLPSPGADVSAARPSPGCHEHSVRSTRSRKKISSLSCFVLLTTCFYFDSKAWFCSAGESAAETAEQSPTPPLPEPRAEEEAFRVLEALTRLLRDVGSETLIAYEKAKRGGGALVKSVAEKSWSAREKAKVVADRAYAKLLESSGALAAAAQVAARKAREAAMKAGRSVRNVQGRIWTGTGRTMQRVGGWMAGPESERREPIEQLGGGMTGPANEGREMMEQPVGAWMTAPESEARETIEAEPT